MVKVVRQNHTSEKATWEQSKEIPMVKVVWQNHTSEKATWELEVDMWLKYPHMFQE